MAKLPRFPITLPLRGWALAGLCALYLLAGLIGHDPWKNDDDAIHFGIVHGFLTSHDWLLPRLAGEAYFETPPLYYWVAAACAKIFGTMMPLHDAVRLASGLFGALFLYLLALASRILHDLESAGGTSGLRPDRHQQGAAATLIAIGCLGLLLPIHETQPMVALLAASAASYAGFALLPWRPLAGGVLAGLGMGLGFLASGLIALITLAPMLLLLPLNRHWRSTTSLGGIAIALLVAVPLCAGWPLLLLLESPATFTAWWSRAVAGVAIQGGWHKAIPDHLELLAWFAWPALPLALWALWLNRKNPGQPALFLPLAGAAVALGCLLLIYGPRPLFALPVLVPLILLATSSANRLRRGATNAFDWFAMMTFTLVAIVVWIYGLAIGFGFPPRLAQHLATLAPGFVAKTSLVVLIAAVLLSLAWVWLIFASPRSPWRAATHWAAGMTLMWVLMVALWMPGADYRISYRSVAVSLRHALSDNVGHPGAGLEYPEGGRPYPQTKGGHQCIAGRGLGHAQRVSLQYFADIVTVRADTPAGRKCGLLLVQGPADGKPAPSGWLKVWEGHRPGDRSERLRLYRRELESERL